MRAKWALKRLSLLAILLFAGCQAEPEIVVYTALDSVFSEDILEEYGQENGMRVRPRFDTESTKTVGLTEAIISESKAGSHRCDVFWNNEILNTLRLEREGLLDVYFSPAHEHYPDSARSPKGTWHGFAARARVLIVNTNLVPEADWPSSILDLTNPKWKGRTGIGKPLFGTTATHAACLFEHWGDERAKEYFRSLKKNEVRIESGNKQVALRVASGQLAFGMTDTDDAIIELERGMPVAIIYPDQGEGQMGTLFIPNTLAILKGSTNSEAAKRLVDHLLSPEVEERLAKGKSAQIPLNPRVKVNARVETPSTIRAIRIDFDKAAAKWDVTAKFLVDEFTAP